MPKIITIWCIEVLCLLLLVTSCNPTISPDDFALNMVNGLIKSGATDARDLQERINDPGINNIDTDRDGKADYILVKEGADDSVHHFTYVAHPRSGAEVPFATTSFTESPEGVEVHSAFLEVVSDYEDHYYRDTLGHDHAFAHWVFFPHPFYSPFVPHSYIYRSTVSRSTFTTVRRTYQSRTNITPSPPRQRPPSFSHTNPSRPSPSRPSVTPKRSESRSFESHAPATKSKSSSGASKSISKSGSSSKRK